MLRCLNELRHVILDALANPWRENDFLNFWGFGTQIESGQNIVSTAAPSLSNILSAMIGVG